LAGNRNGGKQGHTLVNRALQAKDKKKKDTLVTCSSLAFIDGIFALIKSYCQCY
jgi:hypothetical protein